MYPLSTDVPQPHGSFQARQAVPVHDPADPSDPVSICFHRDWLPLVLGCLTQLLLQSTWNTATEAESLDVRYRAQDLIDLFDRPQCALIAPPYWTDADNVDGESTADTGFPWYVDISDWIITAFLATTIEPGAAVAFMTAIRKLRIAFRQRNIGAMARIFVDDLLQVELDTANPVDALVEVLIDLDDPPNGPASPFPGGTHTLRIEHYGQSGEVLEVIRKRLDTPLDETMFDVRSVGCVLEKSTDGGETWVEFADLSTCGAVGPQGPQGIQGIQGPEGTCDCSQPEPQPGDDEPIAEDTCRQITLTLPGNGGALVPFLVSPGDTVQLISASGLYHDGAGIYWTNYEGRRWALGLLGETCYGADAGDPLQTACHMALLAGYGSTYIDISDGAVHTIESATSEALILEPNDGDKTDNFGSITVVLEICHPAAEPIAWCVDIDWTASAESLFTLHPDGSANTIGEFIADTGWRHTDGTFAGQEKRGLYIDLALSPNTLTKVSITYVYQNGSPQSGVTGMGIQAVSPTAWIGQLDPVPDSQLRTDTYTGEWENEGFSIYIIPSSDSSAPYTYGGEAQLQSIHLEGLSMDGNAPTELSDYQTTCP